MAQSGSPWPHRLALVLVATTFPLIWVGGLVTTYDAGMAVPDWPTTYGYNLFLYPWATWLFGPWDLFIEHGHRLLGALVGLLTIGFVVCAFRYDSRRWLRYASIGALLAVILQGSLGGARVLLDERQLAMLHGCFGPLFFAITVVLAAVTSRYWQSPEVGQACPAARRLHRLALATFLLAYLQLILGAQLRHVPVGASPQIFRALVWGHLVTAFVLTAHVGLLFRRLWLAREPLLRRPAVGLLALVLLQLSLGGATWVVKYSLPNGLGHSTALAGYTIQAEGLVQAYTVTAHVATGSLILVTAALVLVRSLRLRQPVPQAQGSAEAVHRGASISLVAEGTSGGSWLPGRPKEVLG